MTSFKEDFNITASNSAAVSGNVVSTLQAGCFFGVIGMAFLTDKIGRRLALILCGVVFNVGAVFQTSGKGVIGLFYAGRVVSGLAVGAASMLTPTFISEMSPKNIRGKLLTSYGVMLFTAITIAYWIDYACDVRLTGSNQWRVPVAIQLVPGTALMLGMIPIEESPRWLVKKGKREQALENLKYIRKGDFSEQEIIEEFAEICDGVDLELAQTEGLTWKECLLPGNRKRFLIAIALMICQQTSGTLAFTYYAPVFFKFVGLSAENTSLFATGVYGIVKSCSSALYMLLGIERVGRKWSLMWGGTLMGAVMLIIGVIYATLPPQQGGQVSSASYAMIVMIYIYCVGYSCSWGPVPWTYAAEIFPTRLREYGVTTASATQWAFNYLFSKVVPFGVQNIGWRLFLMFAIFNFANVIFTWFIVKETKGLSLEEMENLFSSPDSFSAEDSHARAQGIVANLHDEKLAEVEELEVQGDV
jgi:sugar porter (SP) family MFS transporter